MGLGAKTFGLASTKVEHPEGPLRDCIWPVWGSNKEYIYIYIYVLPPPRNLHVEAINSYCNIAKLNGATYHCS